MGFRSELEKLSLFSIGEKLVLQMPDRSISNVYFFLKVFCLVLTLKLEFYLEVKFEACYEKSTRISNVFEKF